MTIEQIREVLDSGASLSAKQKSDVKALYIDKFGVEPQIRKGCADCWTDAMHLLIGKNVKTGIYTIARGYVFNYNGQWYGRHNMTDEIAEAALKEQPDLQIIKIQ